MSSKFSKAPPQAFELLRELRRIHARLGDAIERLGHQLGLPAESDKLPTERLSARELEVLSFLREAKPAPQVAEELGTSVHTVRNHIRSIYRKLGVHSRAELVRRLSS